MSESKDIVAVLEADDAYNAKFYERDPLHRKAAAEIRRLRTANEELVGALKECAGALAMEIEMIYAGYAPWSEQTVKEYDRAREPVTRARAVLARVEVSDA